MWTSSVLQMYEDFLQLFLKYLKLYDLTQRDNQNYLQYNYSYMGSPPTDSNQATEGSVLDRNLASLKKIYTGATGYAQGAICPAQ